MWNYNTYNNPFDRNRISGSLNIINGNGTVIFELKNLEYDEDGVFTLEMLEIFKSEKLGINVKFKVRKALKSQKLFNFQIFSTIKINKLTKKSKSRRKKNG